MVQAVIYAIIAAIAIPQFLKMANPDHRDCLRRLVRVADGAAAGAAPPVCPVTEQPYRAASTTAGTGESAVTTVVWRCPDPEHHLGTDHQLAVRGGTAVPHAAYPPLERIDGGPEVQDDLWLTHSELHDAPDALIVRQSAGNAEWLFAWALVITGVIVTVVFAVMLAGRLAGASWVDPDVSLGCVLIWGAGLLLVGHYVLGTSEIRFAKQAPVVTLQNHYWLFSGGVTEVRNPEALWLPPNLTEVEVLHTDAEGEPVQTALFDCGPGGRGLLGPLHATLFGAGTVHPEAAAAD